MKPTNPSYEIALEAFHLLNDMRSSCMFNLDKDCPEISEYADRIDALTRLSTRQIKLMRSEQKRGDKNCIKN